MEIIYLVGIAGWNFLAWKWADWNRFLEFRASIYVMIIGDLVYNCLTESRHLWLFESPKFHFTHNIIDVVLAFGAFPFVVMLFLSHYPENGILKQVLYNLFWISIFSSHEWLVTKLGVFTSHNGWNFGWSIILNAIAFPFIRLHQKRPVVAIFVFFICVLVLSFLFKLPIVFENHR